jgi:hypothetical protein
MNIKRLTCYFCILFTSIIANAGLIDFEETAYGQLPFDNGQIELSDTFTVDGVTVRFGFDVNSDGVLDTKAVFEEVGNVDLNNDTGFWGIKSAKDIPAPGYSELLGNFFLRQSEPYKPFGIFSILYDSNNPVTGASGEIWDIDGGNNTEQFLVQAFNGSSLVDSILSPLGNNKDLNGKPWAFGFSGLTNITKINITFTGSKRNGIGLAFNNFSPIADVSNATEVPEPKSIIILAIGFLGLVSRQFIKTL